jgi:D-tyrosyl-tRNA(Tyr) deacylase
MRIIAQRVLDASVTVQDKIVGQIGRGILVLVGFTKGDNKDLIKDFASKTVNMRLWEKDGKAWSSSVKDINGEILVVSQFTLYGYFKGNKPDFHDALGAEEAREFY